MDIFFEKIKVKGIDLKKYKDYWKKYKFKKFKCYIRKGKWGDKFI